MKLTRLGAALAGVLVLTPAPAGAAHAPAAASVRGLLGEVRASSY
jgi:hypothetical protein